MSLGVCVFVCACVYALDVYWSFFFFFFYMKYACRRGVWVFVCACAARCCCVPASLRAVDKRTRPRLHHPLLTLCPPALGQLAEGRRAQGQ